MTAERRRAVVVNGASTGIGAACARYLNDKGFRVFATVRKQSDADRVRVEGRPGREPLFLDVTDTESIAKAARSVGTALDGDGLAGLVNNAGVSVDAPLECVDISLLRHQLTVLEMATAGSARGLPWNRRSEGWAR